MGNKCLYRVLSNFCLVALLSLLSCYKTNVQMVDVPYADPGPLAPTSVDIQINEDNFAKSKAVYFKVRAYSSVGTVQSPETVSDLSQGSAVTLASCNPFCTVHVSWDANTEKGVNRTGGGYRVYYSDVANFNIK